MTIVLGEKFKGLTKFEEEVLKLIEQLLNKHFLFQFDATFIDFCQKKLKSSEMEVYKGIYSLIKRKIIVPGSSLTQKQVLENQTRALIFKTIRTHPGIHIRELCDMLIKNCSIIYTHLKVLENFDYIRRKDCINPKYTLFFQKDFPNLYDDYFIVWKNKNIRRIIHLLLDKQLTVSELSLKLNLHHSTIQYHLERLENYNLINRIPKNQAISYTFDRNKLEVFREFFSLISKIGKNNNHNLQNNQS